MKFYKKGEIRRVRGMRDLLPPQSERLDYIRQSISKTLTLSGFRKIQTPILEHQDLYTVRPISGNRMNFKRTYNFTDRLNNDHLVLRPDNTVPVVRVAENYALCCGESKRLWYDEPMFRRERNQKGRYRQFNQIGVEVLGSTGIEIEAELLVLGAKVLGALGLKQFVLKLNSIGTCSDRKAHEMGFTSYLIKHLNLKEQKSRCQPASLVRLLDSKHPAIQEVVLCSPKLHNYFCEESLNRFYNLQNILKNLKIQFSWDPYLVRGLDYYDHTVYEWYEHKHAPQALGGGGRYDRLLKSFNLNSFGCGWALGLDRIEETNIYCPTAYVDVYILYSNIPEWRYGLAAKEILGSFNLVSVLCPRKWTERTRRRCAEHESALVVVVKHHGNYQLARTPSHLSMSKVEMLVSYILNELGVNAKYNH